MTLAIESSTLPQGRRRRPEGAWMGRQPLPLCSATYRNLGSFSMASGHRKCQGKPPPPPCDAVGAMLALLSVFMDLPAAVLEPGRALTFRFVVALAILVMGWLAAKISK